MYKFFAFILLILLIIGCKNEELKDDYEPQYSVSPAFNEKPVYIFGVHPLHNPKRLFESYEPMIDYINARLPNAQLRLEASRNYATYNKKILRGQFDFALPNPYQTILAADHGYTIFGKMGDDENFKGIILVRKDSQIHIILDLKGKTISYPAPTALAATMMPQWYLYQHGININKDITNSYVGSQDSSIMNVYLRKSDAAATWPPPWNAFKKERPEIAKELIVKWETFPLQNNGLVVRNDVPKDLVKKVTDIIINLHTTEEGRKILQGMEVSHYEKADNETYTPVRSFLKIFEKEIRPIKDDK